MDESYAGGPTADEVYAIRSQIAEVCGCGLGRTDGNARAVTANVPGLARVTVASGAADQG